MQKYDVVVIGAGHNSMVCANYLARKGKTVLVLEQSDSLGGLASQREFHPGFKASIAHTIQHFSSKVASDLKLAKYGFKMPSSPLPTIGLNVSGDPVILSGYGASAGICGVDEKDSQAYTEYLNFMQIFVDILKPFWLKTIPRIAPGSLGDMLTYAQLGLKLRSLGRQDMGEFMRIATLPARDLMDENFDNDLLKAVLSWDGLIGSKMAPRSPNATVLTLLYKMSGLFNGGHGIPANGVAGLINALYQSAVAQGVEFKLSSPVSRISVEASENGQKVVGVELEDGQIISADKVVSGADPKQTFVNLLGVENLEIQFTNRINRLRCDGYVAKLHLALKSLPKFKGLDNPQGRLIIAPTMDAIEFAYDHAKYGECSNDPVMEVVLPSLSDASAAPKGQHTLSAHIMYIPHNLKGGWTKTARNTLYKRLVAILEKYAPGIKKQIIQGELLTPLDLEQQYNVTGGHWHHTEQAMDQMFMMRPTYEAAQYATPVSGLFLCGAGTHPGGGLMGAAGHNAAKVVLGAKVKS